MLKNVNIGINNKYLFFTIIVIIMVVKIKMNVSNCPKLASLNKYEIDPGDAKNIPRGTWTPTPRSRLSTSCAASTPGESRWSSSPTRRKWRGVPADHPDHRTGPSGPTNDSSAVPRRRRSRPKNRGRGVRSGSGKCSNISGRVYGRSGPTGSARRSRCSES